MRFLALLGLLVTAVAGCKDRSTQQFIPEEQEAREALEAVLTAWKSGQPFGRISSGPVPIDVLDAKWQAGKKLSQFSIVKQEQEDGKGLRWFTVKLTMEGPSGEATVRYVVFGDNPLWVMREEDYKKTSGVM
jgi:hypothetical protein